MQIAIQIQLHLQIILKIFVYNFRLISSAKNFNIT